MSEGNGSGRLFADVSASAVDASSTSDASMITSEREEVERLGAEFAKQAGGVWLLISGRFTSGHREPSTESIVKNLLLDAFGYPEGEPDRTLNVLLDSPGGSLDGAYATALYLSAYAKELKVYVPGRAKSASTLLAIRADELYLSAFGELGPLDTQIADPRNPTNTVSALDCYQSVDYVRNFGFETITSALPELVKSTERRIPVTDLLVTASTFAIGAIEPVLRTITTLDLGAWGRSLRIGEQYARMLLQAKTEDGNLARADHIAWQLVYGYTHHPFPIDYHEAKRIGLNVMRMKAGTYEAGAKVVHACNQKNFVGFLSEKEAKLAPASRYAARSRPANKEPRDGGAHDRPQAEVGVPGAYLGPDTGLPTGIGPDTGEPTGSGSRAASSE